jgi:peptidyl-prolyl cis-trans isomerase D
MLKVLRDNLKYLSWILWVVILVFIAFVFVDFGGALGAPRGATTPAATVGGATITYKAFEREYRRLEEQYRQAFGGDIPAQFAEQLRLPVQALDRLIDRELLAEEARRRGLAVSDAEVSRFLLAQPALQGPDGKFVGKDVYERFVRQIGYSTPREFEDAVREDLAIEKLTETLVSSVPVAEDAVERSWRDANERAQVRYLLFSGDRHLAAAQPTTEQIAAHFAAHRSDFRIPEQRVVDYLLVDTAKLRATLEIPAAEVEKWYRENLAEFSRPEEVRARHILVNIDENRDEAAAAARMDEVRGKLAAGTPFEQLAREYSDDPGSRERGGDLDYFGRGRMIREFEEAAFNAGIGQVVGPVRTTYGLHLIEVLDRRAGGTTALAEAEPRIRARLAGERARAAAETRARELAAALAGKGGSEEEWKKLADENVVTFVTTPAVSREDSVPGIGRNQAFTDAAFALEPGGVSAPVEVPRGWLVMRLREARPPREPELAEVEARVRAAVQREQAAELARAEAATVRARLGAGSTLDAIAAELGLEVTDSGEFTPGGSIPGLGAARPLAEATAALETGQFGGPVAVPAGAVVFELVSKTPFDRAAFEAAKTETRDQLRREEAQRLLSAILAERREAAGVTYDRPLLEQYGLLDAGGRS